jgi:hypothetical protein
MTDRSANLRYSADRVAVATPLAERGIFLSTNRVAIILACCTYFFALNWSYLEVDSLLYSNLGFLYASAPFKVFLTAMAMAILPALWLPCELRCPSQVCYWMIYLCVVVPAMFLPYHVLNYHAVSEIIALPLSIVACFAMLGLCYRLPPIRVSPPDANPQLAIGLITCAAILLICLVVYISGLQFSLSLDDAYDRRMDARETVAGGSLRSYAVATLSHSFGPLLIAIGYVRRNVLSFAVGITGAVCIFSLAGTKTDIAMPVFLFALLWLITRYRRNFGVAIALSATLLVALSVFQVLLFDRNDLSVYFVRRQIFCPGLLTCFYWDYFSTGEYIYFSDSFLRSVVPQQYGLPMARLIGEAYFGSAEANANANVWASAFANLGYAGMFGFTGLLGLLFRLIDSIAERSDFLVAALMCGMFGLTWTNGGLQTSLLSNGVFVSLIALYFLQSSGPASVGSLPSLPSAASAAPRSRRQTTLKYSHR